MQVFISGLHSGTNPQPGVGIARSIRAAFPDAEIVGVEYSNRSSGVHWTDFNRIWLNRPWAEINLDFYAAEIAAKLDAGALWISGSDLESLWLSDVFPVGHRNLLTPSANALRQTAKPEVIAAKTLPVTIPPFVSTELSNWDLHEFCRQNDWRLWLKGPYYEAVRVSDWTAFEHWRRVLERGWTTEKLFLQTHVSGYEQSISLAAYDGELLDCVYMHKRDLTPENKTWAGETSAVEPALRATLAQVVKEINWTGGAELEMVRDAAEKLWLIEWNPRFPAWIHGATLCGFNLPGALVAAVSKTPAQKSISHGTQFSRVVLEIPTRAGFPLAPLPEPLPASLGHSLKHPAGLTNLAAKLHERNDVERVNETQPTIVPETFLTDLKQFDFREITTPTPLFLEQSAAVNFARAAELSKRISTPELRIINAYSLKTNPDARLLRLARKHGFMAEAISAPEAAKALATGFPADEIILNGPGKWWRREMLPKAKIHAVFADSIADFERTLDALKSGEIKAKTVGVRLRTPNITSRFGIPVDSPDDFQKLIEVIKKLPSNVAFGVHFHFAASVVGVRQWWHLFESMLRWARSIETLSDRKIEILDLGGGWFPDDLDRDFADEFTVAVQNAKKTLPHLREILTENGKAVAQPAFAVAMRLLEISGDEAVVDGSIAELPMNFFYPHRIFWQNGRTREWSAVERGETTLFGRLCMEHDIVAANVKLPAEAEAGDVLTFFDAGGYDQSMSYNFGQG